jgi:hypothetical protein
MATYLVLLLPAVPIAILGVLSLIGWLAYLRLCRQIVRESNGDAPQVLHALADAVRAFMRRRWRW